VNEFLVEGQPYRLPMWLINGVGEGPSLVVTAGVHAAEYASIAAALELGRSLDPGSLSGRVIVVPVLDMPAFTARSIYVCPLDGKNPNRVFPGNPQGSASEQIADWVFRNVMCSALLTIKFLPCREELLFGNLRLFAPSKVSLCPSC